MPEGGEGEIEVGLVTIAATRRVWYRILMTKKQIEAVLERVPDWPEDARRELARIALEIEADLGKGAYTATPEELRGIDRGLRDAAGGRFASEAEVETAKKSSERL